MGDYFLLVAVEIDPVCGLHGFIEGLVGVHEIGEERLVIP